MNLSPVSKAIAGAFAAVLVQLLTRYGIVLDPDTDAAVRVLVDTVTAAAIGYLVVYAAPKNKQ